MRQATLKMRHFDKISQSNACRSLISICEVKFIILEIDILGATKVDSDWLIGRASSRIGIVPITYLKDTNTTQILFCGEDFYDNIVELKQKEQIWILQEKNSQLQAQVSFRVGNRALCTTLNVHLNYVRLSVH